MPYSLYRTRDGAGDSGSLSVALKNENGEIVNGGDRPRVGYAMQVGSINARSYQFQDYWQTTYITEILEEQEDYGRFRTGNSEYEWRKF